MTGAQALASRWALSRTDLPELTVDIFHAGLACCALEIQAAQQRGDLVPSTGEARASVFVIAGTLTRALVPGVVEAIRATNASLVMAFGACATSGGPYWDAPSVVPGIDEVLTGAGLSVPIVTYVPGCPPDPDAFISALSGCVS